VGIIGESSKIRWKYSYGAAHHAVSWGAQIPISAARAVLTGEIDHKFPLDEKPLMEQKKCG
jgi:hypothetical protein